MYTAHVIRQWLRRLIGWPVIHEYARQHGERIHVLEKRIDDLEHRLDAAEQATARLRAKRDHAGQSAPIVDWETAQAVFLGDPKNFDERSMN